MFALLRKPDYIKDVAVDIAANIALCTAIPFAGRAGGGFYLSAGTVTSLSFYGAATPGGTFVPLYDKYGEAATITVANTRGYPFHEACFGWAEIKLVSAANAATAQVSVKS